MAIVYDKQRFPRSTATNVYDLLTDVQQAILDEPRRYHQGLYWTRNKDFIRSYLSQIGDPSPAACGTMACRAGWITGLALGRQNIRPNAVADRAVVLLFGTNIDGVLLEGDNASFYRDIDALFEEFAFRTEGFTGDEVPPIGSKPYALLGARGLRTFQKKWAKRLKATPLPRRRTPRRRAVAKRIP